MRKIRPVDPSIGSQVICNFNKDDDNYLIILYYPWALFSLSYMDLNWTTLETEGDAT